MKSKNQICKQCIQTQCEWVSTYGCYDPVDFIRTNFSGIPVQDKLGWGTLNKDCLYVDKLMLLAKMTDI